MLKNEEIGQNLKEFADKNFSSVAEFSRQLGMKQRQDIYIYFKGKSLLGSEKLARLAELGCDINWLLNGSPAAAVREPGVNYGAVEFKTAIDTLNERLDKLEKQNAGLIAITAAALEKLQEYDGEKDEAIRRLHVQFVSLLALNQINDLTKSDDNNIQ